MNEVEEVTATGVRHREVNNTQRQSVRQRAEEPEGLIPLDTRIQNNKSRKKTNETTIPNIIQQQRTVLLKNYLHCMMIRMIANKNGQKNDSRVVTYDRRQGNQKVTKAQNYIHLFSVILFEKSNLHQVLLTSWKTR